MYSRYPHIARTWAPFSPLSLLCQQGTYHLGMGAVMDVVHITALTSHITNPLWKPTTTAKSRTKHETKKSRTSMQPVASA